MTTHTHAQTPLERLRHHVSGAIARGESAPIVEVARPAKHTRGPWSIEAVKDYMRPHDTGIDSEIPESIANARLIAAAPDLLEALRGLLRETKAKNPNPKVGKDFSLLVYIEAASKAIAQAEGEQ